jgi:hypothetical protein
MMLIVFFSKLGFEEENIWQKTWEPPKELLGPHGKMTTLYKGILFFY